MNGANATTAQSAFFSPDNKKSLRMAKNKNISGGLVYSTNSDFMNSRQEEPEATETAPKEKQKLRIKLDTKQRAGKKITLIEGFRGKEEDLAALGKMLKTKCGAGGSVKDGLIMIQGDYKDKVLAWLKELGYVNARF